MQHLQIIDIQRKGNVVRFHLGDIELEEWWGAHWNKTPYEHHAGVVNAEFRKGVIDVAFNFQDLVVEASDSGIYSSYCKYDLVEKCAPALIIARDIDPLGEVVPDFHKLAESDSENILKFYLGDPAYKLNILT